MARCRVRTVEAVTNLVIDNTSLVELFSVVTKQVWAFDDEKARSYRLRWEVVDAMSWVQRGLLGWPRTPGPPVTDPLSIPFEDVAFTESRDQNLKHLSKLIRNLVGLRQQSLRLEYKARAKEEAKKLEEAQSARAAVEVSCFLVCSLFLLPDTDGTDDYSFLSINNMLAPFTAVSRRFLKRQAILSL